MILNIRPAITVMLLIHFVSTGCRKEKTPEPTRLDENYLVVKDNPNDPVDHQIFQFYQSTRIPCYYNDTVSKKQVGVSSTGVPQFSVQVLTLSYNPLGASGTEILPTQYKQFIPAILELLKTELIPRLPAGIFIPSIIFVDSFRLDQPVLFEDPWKGWDAYHGFNTVAIKCRDVAAMNAAQKKLYIASILAGISARKIINTLNPELQKDFYKISRDLAMPEFQMDVYTSYPIDFILPVIPEAEHYGFLHYVPFHLKIDDFEMTYTYTPREEGDLRVFLVEALYNTTAAFNSKYDPYPAIKEKFRILKAIASNTGLQFPD